MALIATTDRRTRRTRALLHSALIELILERGYDRVTVQDILDRADVGRSTFYNHYQSKDELLLSRAHDLEAAVRSRISTSADQQDSASLMSPLRPIFEHADDNRALCQAMLSGRAANLALRSGRAMLREVLTTHLRSRLAADDDDRLDLAVTFVISGLLGVLTRWLDTNPELPATTMFDHFECLATEGINGLLGDDART